MRAFSQVFAFSKTTVPPWDIRIRLVSNDARTAHLRELRVQHEGRPYRLFYAFNPLRTALMLIGGDKTGDDRFYERMVPIADALYATHLHELRKEGKIR